MYSASAVMVRSTESTWFNGACDGLFFFTRLIGEVDGCEGIRRWREMDCEVV